MQLLSLPFSSLATLTLAVAPVFGLPYIPKRTPSVPVKRDPWLALDTDFPDPAFLKASNGKWYAFGTIGNGLRMQVAESDNFSNWTSLNKSPMPKVAEWEQPNTILAMAPDVIQRADGKYVMYYSSPTKRDENRQCVGTGIANDPSGPYEPSDEPFACPFDQGGAIDASGFQDIDGTRYVTYKVNGNTIGKGECGNSIPPLKPTPLMLQKVREDGITPVGKPIQMIDRATSDNDGPLVEAPYIFHHAGTYFLFYSTHCYNSDQYDLRYATAANVTGPWQKDNAQLLKPGQYGLKSPGGASLRSLSKTLLGDGSLFPDGMLFHGWCHDKTERCMYAAKVRFFGNRVVVV
ncbi:endo-arabinase [Penicillium alfredii]|uniref:Endo-arabinase n=1 Tax=Penicillium alfredii TaxID=1506179 RepID=A0A9W9F091_9EURO|nr:endo-arabinase [Penicillium alfredii]KAJ5091149.1 endo-arabinase [Penicillium alfredii]